MMKRVAVAVWCVVVTVALSCGQAGATVLEELNSELAGLAKSAGPSVVEISARDISARDNADKQFGEHLSKLGIRIEGSGLAEAFKSPRVEMTLPAQSVGSGFVIDEAGYILTTSDVAKSDKLTVKFADGTRVEGKVVGRDDVTNAAVIKVDKSGLKPLPLGDSASLDIGNLVVCVNNQAGLVNTVSLGIVAGLDRKMDEARDLIQISGTIGPGASGGPVLDCRGRVVGMTFAMFSPTSSALPFNYPKIIIGGSGMTLEAPGTEEDLQAWARQLSELKKQELEAAKIKQDYAKKELQMAQARAEQAAASQQEVGQAKVKAVDAETDVVRKATELQAAERQISLLRKARPITEDFEQAARLTTRTSGSSGFAIPINRIKPIIDDLKAGKSVERGWLGAMMGEKDGKIIFGDLEDGSPAGEAGLKAGDVLVSADGKRFDAIEAFTSYVQSRKPGDVMKIVVSRDGKECEVSATLGRRPTAPEIKGRSLSRAFGRSTFSLSVEDAGIAQVAKKLSDASGVSVIVSEPEKIRKKVTVNLKPTTVEKALDVICRTLGCQYKKDGDAYVISPR